MTPSFSTVQGRGGRRSRVQRARAVRFPAGANVAQAFGHDAQAWAKSQRADFQWDGERFSFSVT
jgi:hypothetical protein